MDDAHRRKLAMMAEGMARLEAESIAREARLTPGERVERGLELSELVRRSQTNRDKPLPPSLVALWRARHGVEG